MRLEGLSSTTLLDAAVEIGRDLCRTAYWDCESHRCNWMGRSSAEISREGGPITPTAAALGAELYGGSAGVALFLAQLCAVTGQSEFGHTALGAIRRSIGHLGRGPAASISPLSFFGGHLGVAYAAHRIAALTGQDSLDTEVERLLERVHLAKSTHHLLDLIGGNAGAIPCLLTLDRDFPGSRCVELAIELGDELLRTAVRTGPGPGLAWAAEAASGPGVANEPLTGMAHGAAGIGLALLELHAATGRHDFLQGALGAFAYEDSLFDARRGNWPDLRDLETSERTQRAPRFALAWCHGAPGIALSRLRAAALDPTRAPHHRASTEAGITTTLAAIEKSLKAPKSDATICHGLAGLIEIVLLAGELLNNQSWTKRAQAAGRALSDRHLATGAWSTGVASGGPNPSLMVGTAGIGYVLLRLNDSSRVPSILLLAPPIQRSPDR